MRGLLDKALRETLVPTLGFATALLVFEALVTYVLPQAQQGIDEVFAQMPFVKRLLGALLGMKVEGGLTSQMVQAFLFVHPVVLTIVWSYAIVVGTRMPVAEIDRGTIDVLLSWPVSRRTVFLTETLVAIAGGLVVLAGGFLGHRLCVGTMPAGMRPPGARVALVYFHFFTLYVAVGGLAVLCSSFGKRRARSVALVAALVVASFLLNFLAQFWKPAGEVSFLSLLHYYRPAVTLSEGRLPLGDLAVLLGIGAVGWMAGGLVFTRRNIQTT